MCVQHCHVPRVLKVELNVKDDPFLWKGTQLLSCIAVLQLLSKLGLTLGEIIIFINNETDIV